MWIATASNGIFVLKNDSVVKTLSSAEGLISNNIKSIAAGRSNDIWVGTNSGLTIISYQKNLNKFEYQNLTINDGLSSNIINEMVYGNDTMYCATGNGISAIPASIRIPTLNIPVRLLSVTINGKDTSVSAKYELSYRQKNIELHLAGVELGGHFNYFQYSIDGSAWQSISGNILTLRLNSGDHKILIRAVDVNGNIGTTPLVILFSLARPFWNSLWFWVVISILSVGLVAWVLRKNEIKKREAGLQSMLNQKRLTELELQALKSQINPHFIFNCLNSIKLLNHQQKYAEAELYLDRFAALLRSAIEQSSLKYITLKQEMDFIENYLSLEQLRFPEKLSFKIEAEQGVNTVDLLIPSMILQPFVENAVKHGITPLNKRRGMVQVRFYKKGRFLFADIVDNGVGMDKETRSPGGTGIGIENTERRSRLYNIEIRITNLNTQDGNDRGTQVKLKIPLASY